MVSSPKANSFAKRHPGLSAYLVAMGFVCIATCLLVGLCFIPFVGPAISSGFGAMLGGVGTLFGIETAVEALATGVTAFLLVNFGATVSLLSAAGLVGISLLGAANAAWMTIVAGVYEGVGALQTKSLLTLKSAANVIDKSASPSVLKPIQKKRVAEPLKLRYSDTLFAPRAVLVAKPLHGHEERVRATLFKR